MIDTIRHPVPYTNTAMVWIAISLCDKAHAKRISHSTTVAEPEGLVVIRMAHFRSIKVRQTTQSGTPVPFGKGDSLRAVAETDKLALTEAEIRT